MTYESSISNGGNATEETGTTTTNNERTKLLSFTTTEADLLDPPPPHSTKTNGTTVSTKPSPQPSSSFADSSVFTRSGLLKNNNLGASVRSVQRQRWNYALSITLGIVCIAFVLFGFEIYNVEIRQPRIKAQRIQMAIQQANQIAAAREELCHNVTWEMACDRMNSAAGARRRHRRQLVSPQVIEEEDHLLMDEDDIRVMYDTNCLRIYRLEMFRDKITFPYHGSQLLTLGGNQTMALVIQHGALRNAPNYFCSFKDLILTQQYRHPKDVIIIAPDFNYGADTLVHPNDAYWNRSKPWGDWRVGAESDPKCCGNTKRTVSSFDVLDHMLVLLTDQTLYPHLNKVSFVGHSAGGQMIQRYAVLSILAALWDYEKSVQVRFIVANPSSYTYLTPHRFSYNCGNCNCTENECQCDSACTPMSDTLSIPPTSKGSGISSSSSNSKSANHDWPCTIWNYDRWPYGIGTIRDTKNGHSIPYVERNGIIGTARSVRMYQNLHMIYLVGQNDTCNDNLPVCDAECWKRDDQYDANAGEETCFRNDMDTRCPAMLQGPNRKMRAQHYMQYLQWLYGGPTHILHTIPGVGHNASGIFSSETGMRVLFE